MRVLLLISLSFLFVAVNLSAGWKPLNAPDGAYIAAFGKMPDKSTPKWKRYAYKTGENAKIVQDEATKERTLLLENLGEDPPKKFANYSIPLKGATEPGKCFVVDFRLRLMEKNMDELQFSIAVSRPSSDGRTMNWSFSFGKNQVYCHMRKKTEVNVGLEWHNYRIVVDAANEKAKLYMDGATVPTVLYKGYHLRKNEKPVLRFGDSSSHIKGVAELSSLIWKDNMDNKKLFELDPKMALPAPGILLTFDDHSIANWAAALPIFAKHKAHVTFFIDRFDTLSKSQIDDLKKIKAAGHTVACHSMRHFGAVAYAKKHSVEKYLDVEVRPSVKLMKAAGFPPSAFAYPMSQHNNKIDKRMLRIFRHLRGGCGFDMKTSMADLDAIFTPIGTVGEHGFLCGTCVQPHGINDPILKKVDAAFERAVKRGEIIVFYAHDIRDKNTKGPKNYITPDSLETLLKKIDKHGLKYYTFDDLP